MKRLLAGTLVLAAMLVLPAVAPAANGPKHKDNDTYVQLLAINDLHGHLQPNTPGTIQVGCCNPVFNTATPPVHAANVSCRVSSPVSAPSGRGMPRARCAG